jgi:hypothetical protein
MSPRILLSAAVRAIPLLGPILRRLDRLEMFVLLHEAELDLHRAKLGLDTRKGHHAPVP